MGLKLLVASGPHTFKSATKTTRFRTHFLSSICRIKDRIERKLLDQEATVAAAL